MSALFKGNYGHRNFPHLVLCFLWKFHTSIMSREKNKTLEEIIEKLRQRKVAREQGAGHEGWQAIPSASSAAGGSQRDSASRRPKDWTDIEYTPWTEDDLIGPNKEQPIWFPEQNVRRLGRSRSIASILPKDEPSSQLTPGRGRPVTEPTPVFPQPAKSSSERMESYRLMLESRSKEHQNVKQV